jgi:hypothetical protein
VVAGTGRRKAPPVRWSERGGASSRRALHRGGERIGRPELRVTRDHLFDGSRDRVDNARVWGRRERLQRSLGPSISSPEALRARRYEPAMTITPVIPRSWWNRHTNV